MDRIRTLLLARTHTVVLDPDRVASAATRPSRDVDLERFEDELAQLGFVMSLDLAMTVRRLPFSAIQDLKAWITSTLATASPRAQVPLARGSAQATPYQRRMLTWLATRPEQPCPWCSRTRALGALEPCGHLVCRECWTGGAFTGCPICHRRVAQPDPFGALADVDVAVADHDGALQLVHLAFDVVALVRARLEHVLQRPVPPTPEERAEIEETIDVIGPRAAVWMPARIPIRETMAIAVARLWLVAADRAAMVAATRDYLESPTDVLRVAVVLMGGDPLLRRGARLHSIDRSLRRAVLSALEDRDPERLVEEVLRRAGSWKRVGERLHPFEHAERFPNAALAFAAARGSDVAGAAFAGLRARAARSPALEVATSGDRTVVRRVRGHAVEDVLRSGDAARAAATLARRPAELLRRSDHLLRLASTDARPGVIAAIERAIPDAAPRALLLVGAHVATRGAPWPCRVFVPARTASDARSPRAYVTADRRPALPVDAIEAITRAIYGELVARAEHRRQFARAVVDRALAGRVLPFRGHRLPALAGVTKIGARPTLWDVACVHAAARANVVYVRERDGSIATFRRRDGETALARFSRMLVRVDPDAVGTPIPAVDAPTLVILAVADLAIPRGSSGFVLGGAHPDLVPLRLLADLRRTW